MFLARHARHRGPGEARFGLRAGTRQSSRRRTGPDHTFAPCPRSFTSDSLPDSSDYELPNDDALVSAVLAKGEGNALALVVASALDSDSDEAQATSLALVRLSLPPPGFSSSSTIHSACRCQCQCNPEQRTSSRCEELIYWLKFLNRGQGDAADSDVELDWGARTPQRACCSSRSPARTVGSLSKK
jgi:hypothetical protein